MAPSKVCSLAWCCCCLLWTADSAPMNNADGVCSQARVALSLSQDRRCMLVTWKHVFSSVDYEGRTECWLEVSAGVRLQA